MQKGIFYLTVVILFLAPLFFSSGCNQRVRTSDEALSSTTEAASPAVQKIRVVRVDGNRITIGDGYATRIDAGRFLTAAHVLDTRDGEVEIAGEKLRYHCDLWVPSRDVAVFSISGGAHHDGPTLPYDLDRKVMPGTPVQLLVPPGCGDSGLSTRRAVANVEWSGLPNALVVEWERSSSLQPHPGWSGLPLVINDNGHVVVVGVNHGSFLARNTVYRVFAR